jgi:signal transduction histidine kinase
MRERVAQAGGELHVATRPGQGFEVTALLPARGGAT